MGLRKKMKLKQPVTSFEEYKKNRSLERIRIQIEVKKTTQEAMKRASKKMRVVLTKRVFTRKRKLLKSKAMLT